MRRALLRWRWPLRLPRPRGALLPWARLRGALLRWVRVRAMRPWSGGLRILLVGPGFPWVGVPLPRAGLRLVGLRRPARGPVRLSLRPLSLW
ncbi:hypothetical protein LY12_002895 [Prauserella alba]|uniref:Uncharacterized protein n=1 Tax=Prauserella alba TaxID=176898 RepID=A0ABN1V8Y3_9PSEU|nr:hypothetical protein [Prauserella alba]